jgi:16S rRNA (guanine527-N7)-methyltransferase
VPGLVLILTWPDAQAVLLDSELRKVRFLTEAVDRLAAAGRVEIIHARAEDAGRDPRWRGRFDLVTARSFARPAVTAECGAPFLQLGGRLLVAEPPEPTAARWPAEPLALLGLRDEGRSGLPAAGVRRLIADEPCPVRYPRRPGVPGKRPLFS